MRKNLMLIAVLFCGVLLSGFNYSVKYSKDDILGICWNQEKTSKIEVYKVGDKYHGKIIWLSPEKTFETGSKTEPNLDDKNPDEKLRSRKVLGIEILKGLEWDDDEWDDGEIYDPESGSTYSCYAEFEDDNNLNKLKFRGYIGISLIGRTAYWERVK